MIHLPVRFGDKLKVKNLEVDFLIVDVLTVYNVILGRPTLHKPLKKKNKEEQHKTKGGRLHIRLSAVLTALIFRSPSVGIQGVSGLVLWAVTLTRRGDELNLLGISPLGFGPLAFIYRMKVGFGVGVVPKFLGQRGHDLAQPPLLRPRKALASVGTADPSAQHPNHLFSLSSSLSAAKARPPALLAYKLHRWVGLDEVRGRSQRANGSVASGLRSGPPGPWDGSILARARGVVPGRPAPRMPRRGRLCGLRFAGVCEQEGLPLVSCREALKRVPVQGKTFLVKLQPRVTTKRREQGSCSYLLSLLIN
ncbi:hypothetical protein Cgig2_009900 [Carnegiea gigantea]|uniref:Uncharacterized protein n=1 Tax=Carnegiea gigantea TaxID=171969 RepID=A0A9Q1K9G6_9CARY|nr:hypothetical protein Cgig2_009900 [Carnegiea gigantea]